MRYVCYSFKGGFLWTSDIMIFWENGEEKWFPLGRSALAISPSFHAYMPLKARAGEEYLPKPRSRIQLRQACASPWHGAWCSALPASLSPHTAAFLSISTQPLSLIHPSWDKAEGPSLSSPRFATKILCPHSLEVSWAHRHVSWLSVTASICLPHLCLHMPPLKAGSLGHLQPALPVWNVLLTCSLCSIMNSLCK